MLSFSSSASKSSLPYFFKVFLVLTTFIISTIIETVENIEKKNPTSIQTVAYSVVGVILSSKYVFPK